MSVQAHQGHNGVGGVQQHSCGPLYPFTVVVLAGDKSGVCYAMHGSTGRKMPEHRFEVGSRESFFKAHAAAEQDVTL